MYKLFGALQVCNSCGFWPLLVSVLVRKDSIVIGLEVCCSFGFFVKINHAVVGVLSFTSHKISVDADAYNNKTSVICK